MTELIKKRLKKLPDDVIIIDDDIIINNSNTNTETLKTEDLGKIFEMAICLLYKIQFDGKYKYSMEESNVIKTRIQPLLTAFPYKLKHTAKNGSQYDFRGEDDQTIKLSAKTTKKDGKVCPQVIGQPSKKKFCEFFNLDLSVSLQEIKNYIISNIANMLNIYFDLTFDCPIIYFNKKSNVLQLIKLKEKIDWNKYVIEFSHIIKNKLWNESSTISINNTSIGEFQLHKHRDCIKFRWCFEKLLKHFVKSFTIIHL